MNYISRYCREDTDGVVRFVDPIYGDLIQLGAPPRCIAEDEISGIGFDRLRSLAAKDQLEVQVLLGDHGARQHWDDILDSHSDIVIQSDVVAIEADWDPTERDQNGQYTDFKPVFPDNDRQREFMEYQTKWLEKNGKLFVSCEPDGPRDSLRVELRELFFGKRIDADPSLSDRERNAFKIVSRGAYNYLRQWAMVGQLGYWLNYLLEEKIVSAKKLSVSFVMGYTHTEFDEKFLLLGVKAKSHSLEREISDYSRVFAYMTRHAAILPEHFRGQRP